MKYMYVTTMQSNHKYWPDNINIKSSYYFVIPHKEFALHFSQAMQFILNYTYYRKLQICLLVSRKIHKEGETNSGTELQLYIRVC